MGSFTYLFGRSPRVSILEAFSEDPDEELSAPEIVEMTEVSRRAVYLHLSKLVKDGVLVRTRKQGKCQYYRFNPTDPRGEALSFLESVLVLGELQTEIKQDEGLPMDAPLYDWSWTQERPQRCRELPLRADTELYIEEDAPRTSVDKPQQPHFRFEERLDLSVSSAS